MDSAEALAIACKTKIVPLKDFDRDLFRKGSYVGTNPLIESLIGHKTEITYPDPNGPDGERSIQVPHWAFVPVPDEKRPKFMDQVARQYRDHGTARVRTKWGLDIQPAVEMPKHRIMAVRTYTCTENAIQNLAYYRRWGQHRSNLVADTTLGPGVLAYPDVQSILDKFNGNHRTDRSYMLGSTKLSLNLFFRTNSREPGPSARNWGRR